MPYTRGVVITNITQNYFVKNGKLTTKFGQKVYVLGYNLCEIKTV